jgi:hypothetical protein
MTAIRRVCVPPGTATYSGLVRAWRLCAPIASPSRQFLVVIGALLGALIGVALGLAVEDTQTSMAVAASGPAGGRR